MARKRNKAKKRNKKQKKVKKKNRERTVVDQKDTTNTDSASRPGSKVNNSSYNREECIRKLRRRQALAREGIDPQHAAQKVRQEMKSNPSLMNDIRRSMLSNNEEDEPLSSSEMFKKFMDTKKLGPRQRQVAERFLKTLSM